MAPVPLKDRKTLQLQCEWINCSEVFKSSQAFTNHLMQHAEEFMAGMLSIEKCLADVDEEDTDEHQCQWVDCGYVTSEGSAALLRHLLFHGYHTRIKWAGTVERQRCKVEPCQLEPHSRNIIPEVPSSFVCSWEDCSFITNNPDFFYCHVEMHSQMEDDRGLLACKWTDCHVKAKDKYKLRDHLRSHSQEKKFGCSQCGGLFSNRTKFFDHIHRQGILDEPNYQCSHCSKVFASERLLRDHMRHHVNHYKCPFCDMTCPAPSVLKKHIQWRHSTERPFSCELCEHTAKTRTDMRRHMESHNAGDAYSCDIETCTYVSKTLSTLRSHFRRCHSDIEEKRYMCHVCEAKFTRGTRLTKHLKDKHRFKWPSGHVRFRYKEHEDGFLRLQTVRYESIELTQQILQESSGTPPLQSIPEEDALPNHSKSREKTEKGKSSKKRSSPRKGSPSKSFSRKASPKKSSAEMEAAPSEVPPRQIQYLQGEHGHIIVVDCTVNLQQQYGEENSSGDSVKQKSVNFVYNVADVINQAPGLVAGESNRKRSRRYVNRKRDEDNVEQAGLYNVSSLDCADGVNPAMDIPAHDAQEGSSTVQLLTLQAGQTGADDGGMEGIRDVQTDEFPVCDEQYHDELDTGAVRSDHEARSTGTLHMQVFPIEQLQGLEEEFSDSDSIGERTPKKARYEFTHVLPENSESVCGITDDERMRNLYPRLEDDRMAMAVEAMTNLSRGFGAVN